MNKSIEVSIDYTLYAFFVSICEFKKGICALILWEVRHMLVHKFCLHSYSWKESWNYDNWMIHIISYEMNLEVMKSHIHNWISILLILWSLVKYSFTCESSIFVLYGRNMAHCIRWFMMLGKYPCKYFFFKSILLFLTKMLRSKK